MREIKFRAWDKGLKRMIYLSEPTVENDDFSGIVFKLRDYFVSAFSSDRIEDLELMQYTGLKDKNGREIYEGDIVKTETDYINTGKITEIGVVEFYEEGLVWIINYGETQINLAYAENIEVIGNIYENPELLKEAEK